eukprot:1371704-Rhodomonas_salina.1
MGWRAESPLQVTEAQRCPFWPGGGRGDEAQHAGDRAEPGHVSAITFTLSETCVSHIGALRLPKFPRVRGDQLEGTAPPTAKPAPHLSVVRSRLSRPPLARCTLHCRANVPIRSNEKQKQKQQSRLACLRQSLRSAEGSRE